jgi:hypothetical protein
VTDPHTHTRTLNDPVTGADTVPRPASGGTGPDPVQAPGPVPAPDAAELERLREEATGLRRTVADLRARLADAEQAHHGDIAAVGARLLEEAEARDWCGEYDEVVDSLNAVLRVPLPLRVRAWEASFDLRISVRIEHARNTDDARAQAATLAEAIERAVYEMTAVTASDVEDRDDFDLTETD